MGGTASLSSGWHMSLWLSGAAMLHTDMVLMHLALLSGLIRFFSAGCAMLPAIKKTLLWCAIKLCVLHVFNGWSGWIQLLAVSSAEVLVFVSVLCPSYGHGCLIMSWVPLQEQEKIWEAKMIEQSTKKVRNAWHQGASLIRYKNPIFIYFFSNPRWPIIVWNQHCNATI